MVARLDLPHLAYGDLQVDNDAWLRPWLATSPDPGRPLSFREQLASVRRAARDGAGLTLVVESEGRLVGSVAAHSLAYGPLWTASLGYWVAEGSAGRGIAPTAVAMLMDHLLDDVGIHRIEVEIRPENERSIRVAEKLGLVEEGRRRDLMYVDGMWRDHRSFVHVLGDLGRGPGAVLRHVAGR
jgi:ribosomal-protein-alanine N-acetyltransferase